MAIFHPAAAVKNVQQPKFNRKAVMGTPIDEPDGTSINQPHPNDQVTDSATAVEDPEDFFASASDDDSNGSGDPGEVEAREADNEVEVDEEAAEVEAVEPDDDDPVAASEPEAVQESAEEDDDDETGNRREYAVLQEVTLDQDNLNDLLKAVKGGVEPIVALVEVHRATVTNGKAALNGAWKRHKAEWETPPRLVVVTASKIRPRTARPRVREVIGFELSD